MARVFWHGVLGYLTEQIRDDVVAAFTAGVAEYSEHLTPAAWDDVPDVPAGIDSPREVDGKPGFTFAFDVLDGWENSAEWAALYDIAQEQTEAGYGQQIHTLP